MTKRDPAACMDNDAWGRAIAEAVAMVPPSVAPHDAEELVDDAALRVLEGEEPWNPKENSLAQHLVEIGLKAHKNRRRTERKRRRPQMMAKLIAFFQPRVPTPQELFFERRHKKERFEALSKKLTGDPEAAQILWLIEKEVLGVREQADETGMSVAEVRNARRRIIRTSRDLDTQAAREDEGGKKVAES